jgi:hypothetical protein
MPATNAKTNPAAPLSLRFMISLLTLVLLPQRTSQNTKSQCMLIQLGRQRVTTGSKRQSTRAADQLLINALINALTARTDSTFR